MRQIDQLHLDYLFAGSRMLRDLLRQDGFNVGRKHVATLMRRIGIEALYRKPRTAKPGAGHKNYPYLLRNLAIDRPNQVLALDITYIPWLEDLFVWLQSSIGSPGGCCRGRSRSRWTHIFSWRLSKTL